MRLRKNILIKKGDLVKWGWEIKCNKVGVVLYACPSGLKTIIYWSDGQLATYAYTSRLLQVISRGSPGVDNTP